MPAKKILIIRFSSIGDVVLTTPMVRCLKKQLKAEIHFLIKSQFGLIIHENPYIDHIHYLKSSTNETIELLKNEKYDLIVDLQKNLKSFRIKQELGCPSVSFDKLNVKKWMAVNLKINRLPNNVHLVDRYFEALKSIGVKDDGQGLDYFILPEDEYDAIGLVNGIKYQVLVLGANHFTKRIPIVKCEEIISASTGNTVLLGGNDVSEAATYLAGKFSEKTINLTGKIGLGVSAGIIKHAEKVITGDTGLMHIAAALQKEIIVLWGNTTTDFGMFPYYGSNNIPKNTNLEVMGLSCRPCSKLGFNACPKGHFKCMMDIDLTDFAKTNN